MGLDRDRDRGQGYMGRHLQSALAQGGSEVVVLAGVVHTAWSIREWCVSGE